MTQPLSQDTKRIAIIGAGPSGLATAKLLIAENTFSQIVIYEQRDTVGGTWNYTPLPPKKPTSFNNDLDQRPPHNAVDIITSNLPPHNTPMYEDLESNLPHTLIQFSDTPFPAGTQLFPARETVLQYLHDYASDILPLIRFEHQVVDVRPAVDDERHAWDVKTTTRASAERGEQVERFDAVVVANGHCEWPLVPDIEGLNAWSGAFPESLYHSVSYKNAAAFANKRTLLVGGGPSAADIERQIAAVCQPPLLVAQIEKSPYHTDTPHVRDYPTLVALNPSLRTATFQDGQSESDLDAILLCTGYAYRFSFLSSIYPTLNEDGIAPLPLYQYVFDINHPTLAFISTPEMSVPFPLAEAQAAVVARVWSGRLSLPSPRKMREWWEGVVSERGAGRACHALAPPRDLDYMREMYKWCCGAEGMEGGGGRGKMPKEWDARACWVRMRAADMRKAFDGRGGERGGVVGYAELGFWFEGKGG